MAVQAQQYPSNAFRVGNGVLEGLQPMQFREDQSAIRLRNRNNHAGQQFLSGTTFSDRESELTCNVSASRKRIRDDPMALMQQQQRQMLDQFLVLNLPKPAEKPAAHVGTTGLQLSCQESRMTESAATSTSGRSTSVFSPLHQDFASCLYQHSLEIDALVRLQTEKIRSGLEETRKRQCRSLLSVLEQQVSKRLKEKETELENASRRNAVLEEKVRQIATENQIWFNVAKNNEAIVCDLRTRLEQTLLQNSNPGKEGYGDSADGIASLADDAQSCCYGDEQNEETEKNLRENREMRRRKACKVCRQNDVSVLLLPCRHLCLCQDCEAKHDSCPICKSVKNASLQIFMS